MSDYTKDEKIQTKPEILPHFEEVYIKKRLLDTLKNFPDISRFTSPRVLTQINRQIVKD